MIPFTSWLSQIEGYCRFVADDLAVQRAWQNKDYSQTSITNFDELYEQIFDDLDSDAIEKDLVKFLPHDFETRDALAAFLEQIRHIDVQREHNRRLSSTAELLVSEEWRRLATIANRVATRSPSSSK